MKNDNAPRVQDIARMANVSTATVSRALSRPDLVSEATRDAVLKAVAEAGYTVNVAARNLRRQRTGSVLALVPNLANPFFSKIIAGINSVLRTRGLTLLVADTEGGPEVHAQMATLAHRSRADGLIVLDGCLPAGILDHPACPPVVQACEWIDGLPGPRVMADNRDGGVLAARHLIDLGHRRIAQLTGPANNPLTIERSRGVREVLAEAGIEGRTDWILEGAFSLSSGQQAAREILAMADRPDAVLCHNDEMACGLMGELQRTGLDVPRDMSVIGFDNIDMAAHVTPGLTTVEQHRTALGVCAAEVLLDLLDGASPPPVTVLPVGLLVRGSTLAR
ncbi:LacI family DNA-binding transcriptional regulator [Falsirhodobacter sp. 20TX0035]|uniref:LacI family DNA-binding transcriptional regulator n=1 Tax=Falsirhodobacter sp. 20TX0035 TaxID=3022019 RepID=UPI00232D7DAB|nr:LacI family DNA-binding transcriptional regulator [Falsirhodobacter sp. 20TX0035]MDB6454557.1 LacI family DNA-binding transcriptional regulator [Falsirhodobacter sp. 20TX0035]